MKKGILLLSGAFLLINSCKHEPEKIKPVVVKVCFAEDVLPIFQTNCSKPGFSCHSPSVASEGYVLDTYQHIIAKGIKPFNPEGSKIYQVITTSDAGDRMPQFPNAALTSDQISKIYSWIAQGATNDSCGSVCDTADVKYSVQVTKVMNDHCIGCHKGASPSSGINLEGYANLKVWVNNGKLAKSVNQQAGAVPMPYLSAKMADCQVRTIQIWIDNGAPNN